MQEELLAEINSKNWSPAHRLAPLAPFVDEDGVMRVGGRLRLADCPEGTKHPVLLPKKSRFTELVLSHHHEATKHQGFGITSSFIRQAGLHIVNATRYIKSWVARCVPCRKLRAALHRPQMADLPPDRLCVSPPFTNVGVDVFGPFLIQTGIRTRRTQGSKKIWAALFTCLVSRAVHIELMPLMDAPTFINALRRFVAIRGPCNLMRSDQGSNFVGATGQVEELNLTAAAREMHDVGVQWIMNPPHASNFGGVWERKIGQIRKALDFSLRHVKNHPLTFDELATLMAEAAAIVNATPLWPQPTNPNDPRH